MERTMIFYSRSAEPESIHRLYVELTGESDRTAAIVGVSFIELCLEEALLEHLHSFPKLTKELFGPSQALGSLGTKIHLGLLTGLYSEKAHTELTTVKKIRNKFAHSLDIDGFQDEGVAALAMNLQFGERYTHEQADPETKWGDPKRPYGEWPTWLSVKDREKLLKMPRERFLLSVQALSFGLADAEQSMPSPKF